MYANTVITRRAPSPRAAGAHFGNTQATIQRLRRYARASGLPFLGVELASGTVLAKTEDDLTDLVPHTILEQLRDLTGPCVIPFAAGLVYYALPLPTCDGTEVAAVGYVLNHFGRLTDDLLRIADELGLSPLEMASWCAQQRFCRTDLLERIVQSVFDNERAWEETTREVSRQKSLAERAQNERRFIHGLAFNLILSQNPVELAESCVVGLQGLTQAAGCYISLGKGKGRESEFSCGDIPLNADICKHLVDQCSSDGIFDPIVRNDVSSTLLGADFPQLHNFLLAPINDGNRHLGWVLLCNLPGGRDFTDVEISLIETATSLIATHVSNRALYEEHDQMLLEFVGSLVSTIDAKDSHTRGHSERVALIARRLGEELNLPQPDLDDIYHAGLLHDIGKIGVNDAILAKPSALTDEEFEHVKQHPLVGYRILRGLNRLHKLLPGVRNHHEEFSGHGYPDRLAGKDIPLLARILAVADAYDAMRSDRPYRRGMPLAKVEQIFRRGAGDQWDPEIIAAYFAAREDIRNIGGNDVWPENS